MTEVQNLSLPQRLLYKLLDRLLSSEYDDEEVLLRSLIHDLVEREEFAVVGGRLWKLLPERGVYRLLYQYGDVEHIPDNYELDIVHQPAFSELAKHRTVTDI